MAYLTLLFTSGVDMGEQGSRNGHRAAEEKDTFVKAKERSERKARKRRGRTRIRTGSVLGREF
jgi:hypothetical protein